MGIIYVLNLGIDQHLKKKLLMVRGRRKADFSIWIATNSVTPESLTLNHDSGYG
jgi:hypothetical protein